MMQYVALSLLLFVSQAFSKKVAVIGGGISGTFFTKYLVDYDKPCLLQDIVIFDPLPLGEPTTGQASADEQGSRVASIKLEEDGSVVEIGASVFYDGFRLVTQMIKADPKLQIGDAFNTGKSPRLDPRLQSGLGVYNGDGDWKFLTNKGPSIWSLFKMAWRYNVDLYKVWTATSTVERSLYIVHQLLESQHYSTFFANAEAMWDSVGLVKPAYHSFDEFLDALGVSRGVDSFPWWRKMLPYQGSLREELLTAINLCNYNQGTSAVNGLVGLGSFVSAKVRLLSVMGGNQQVIKSAFSQAQKSVSEHCKAKKGIVRHSQDRVTTLVGDDELIELFSETKSLGMFDAVILAAPIHSCRINFLVKSQKDSSVLQPMPFRMVNVDDHIVGELPPEPKPLPDFATRPYTQVITTVITNAQLDGAYFGMSNYGLPKGIYMTEHGKSREHNITAISQITPDGAYKIFSSEKLTGEVLSKLFGGSYTVAFEKTWGWPHGGATPDYRGDGQTIDYLLFDSGLGIKGHSDGSALYYPNAIETSMACMELSAIGAKSVAKLVAERLKLVLPITGTDGRNDEL